MSSGAFKATEAPATEQLIASSISAGAMASGPASSRAACGSAWPSPVAWPWSPKLLCSDEPFSALDALTRGTLQDELARIWMERRKTVMMITNDVDEAILLADRIYPMTPGPGATLGPPIPVPPPGSRGFSASTRSTAGTSRAHRVYSKARRQATVECHYPPIHAPRGPGDE